jgi:hypothetical protein
MQTFLPYRDFAKSAECLDRQRLGKQRVEVLQILQALHGETKGWQNHPCTNQWRLHTRALVEYGNAICSEWRHRGYKDTCLDKIMKYYYIPSLAREPYPFTPPWLGNETFHSSHRAALMAKNPKWYSQFNWKEEPKIDYFWPSKNE